MACKKITKSDYKFLYTVYTTLKDWHENKGEEVQIDGKTKYGNNSTAWLIFVEKSGYYKISGDTKDTTVEKFIALHEESKGDFDSIFDVDYNGRNTECLRLKDAEEADGWFGTKV